MYIDGRAYIHKNISGFINSSKGRDPNVRPNCQFVEVMNDKDGDMEREVDRLIMVEPIMDLSIGDTLLINYPLLKCTVAWKKREELGLPKDVRKGRKPKNNQWVWIDILYTMLSKLDFILNYCIKEVVYKIILHYSIDVYMFIYSIFSLVKTIYLIIFLWNLYNYDLSNYCQTWNNACVCW